VAVTVTTLAIDLQVHTDPDTPPVEPLAGVLGRALDTARALVEKRTATDTPEAVKDAAITAIASYLYDRPTAPQGERFSNPWRSSGAASILAPWVVLRAQAINGDADNE